jgi:hypothetical protein
MASPTDQHWLAVKRILRYLKGSIDKGLKLHHSSSLSLNAFTDADWQAARTIENQSLVLASFLAPIW